MKKSIINLMICATVMSSGGVFAATDQMFNNTDSKEWGSTPQNVRNALKNIKVMSGSSANDMMSKNWLNELKRSPSTYNLNQNDVTWVNGMINGTNGKSWNPKTKVSIKNIEKKDTKTANVVKEKIDKPEISSGPLITKKPEVKKENIVSTESKKNKEQVITEKKSDKLSIPKVKKEENNKEKMLAKANKEKIEKEKIEKENLEKHLAENKAKVEQLNSDINVLETEQKVANEIERTEKINRDAYEDQIFKLSNLNNINLVLQNDKNLQDTKEGTDKLKNMIRETNDSLLKQQSLILEEDTKLKESKVSDKPQEIVKPEEMVKPKEDVKPTVSVEIANKVVNEVSNSMKKNEIATNLIKEDIKGNLKSKKIDYKWKNISAYIIFGFSALTILFMGLIGFKKNKEEE